MPQTIREWKSAGIGWFVTSGVCATILLFTFIIR